ncbi:MAG: helix-turn-helix transcriptional regulator [Actinobacteria bacterium]|nr:helix-turn-helix transcriptional regulator [Actinomycetota bacterium]
MAKGKAGKPGPNRSGGPANEKRSMPRRFLLPTVMLLLAEEPAHGYALLDKLVEIGVAEKRLPLPLIYRALLQLESKRMAGFTFAKPGGKGPARKVYHLTEKGWKELASWAESMQDVKDFIAEFQARYKVALELK